MSKTSQSEGTKIAQAAKELNVTSVTIRRYLSEFNIETTTDENGVKVLPQAAMDELQLIRQLKEDGLTNPKVLEELEERRAKQSAPKSRSKERTKTTKAAASKTVEVQKELEETAAEEAPVQPTKRGGKQASRVVVTKEQPEPVEETSEEDESTEASPDSSAAGGRSKHSLTCQTCGKVFEHMNPRLRDCLDCYRTKRKERRRGGSDKHKNVIQHPVVQQVIAKSSQSQSHSQANAGQAVQPTQQPQQRESYAPPAQPTVPRQSTVRNYRKAIEETRGITASLKRRLERPDLPEGERRWLEQIYAYQLILHQGWRHLSEYRAGTKEQHRSE